MRQNVIQLEKFYASRLGAAAQTMTTRRLAAVWPNLHGQEILAYGYGAPFVEPYKEHAKRIILAMPGGQGAIAQTGRRGIISCLIEDQRLPFADAQFDNVLIAHGLEEAESPSVLLAELWRVTKPEGRIIVIASNRSGLWARSEKSPFGAGRPFSRKQLCQLLEASQFQPVYWSGALYAPPWRFCARETPRNVFEQFGETVWPSFSGLVLVEAIKRLYAESGGRTSERVTRPVFGTAPIGHTSPRR